MELSDIKLLLNKYLEAETSLQEEKVLKAYFLSKNVAPELEEYTPLFRFFEAEKNIEPEQPITFAVQEPTKPKRSIFYKWAAVAASFAILASVFWFNSNPNPIQKSKSPMQQELAMQHTQDLLYMMTDAVAGGKKQLSYLKEINQTKNQLINK